MTVLRSIVLIVCMLFTSTGFAWDPKEVLADPALEQRARTISSQVRCLVCQNQSIDESDADLAKDLRLLVRERLTAGDSDEEVYAFLVSRYGEFVLLKPPLRLGTALLWGLPVLFLLIGATFILLSIRKRTVSRPEQGLTADDQARLSEIVDRQ